MTCLTVISCKKESESTETIEVSGTIQKQGITTYQYGTHTIAGYAIRSNALNLDDYVNQNVTVAGQLIDGYPIEDGPIYIDVEKIE